jgi:hypothetical protein
MHIHVGIFILDYIMLLLLLEVFCIEDASLFALSVVVAGVSSWPEETRFRDILRRSCQAGPNQLVLTCETWSFSLDF